MTKDNIVNLKEIPSVVGAYSADYSVVVDGLSIPKIRCVAHGDDIEFILDRRFSFTFNKDVAYLAASFASQAMAIGAGYSNMEAKNKDRPFAPEVMIIDTGL